MDTYLKVSSGSEPLKKAIGQPFGSPDTEKFHIFLNAKHRPTNTKLHSSNAIINFLFTTVTTCSPRPPNFNIPVRTGR